MNMLMNGLNPVGMVYNQSAENIAYGSGNVKNALDRIGTIVLGTATGDVNVPNSTVTEVGSITLSKGVWIILGCMDWFPNENGFRQIAFLERLNPPRNMAQTTANAGASKEAYQQVQLILDNQIDGSLIKLYGYQNSGSTLKAYPYVYAVRIA